MFSLLVKCFGFFSFLFFFFPSGFYIVDFLQRRTCFRCSVGAAFVSTPPPPRCCSGNVETTVKGTIYRGASLRPSPFGRDAVSICAKEKSRHTSLKSIRGRRALLLGVLSFRLRSLLRYKKINESLLPEPVRNPQPTRTHTLSCNLKQIDLF